MCIDTRDRLSPLSGSGAALQSLGVGYGCKMLSVTTKCYAIAGSSSQVIAVLLCIQREGAVGLLRPRSTNKIGVPSICILKTFLLKDR